MVKAGLPLTLRDLDKRRRAATTQLGVSLVCTTIAATLATKEGTHTLTKRLRNLDKVKLKMVNIQSHTFVAGVCRWCATREHWPGATNSCPMPHLKSTHARDKRRAADRELAKKKESST